MSRHKQARGVRGGEPGAGSASWSFAIGCVRVIDIDVVDRTFAPGTGNAVTMGGLLPDKLLELGATASQLPLGQWTPVMEHVAPELGS